MGAYNSWRIYGKRGWDAHLYGIHKSRSLCKNMDKNMRVVPLHPIRYFYEAAIYGYSADVSPLNDRLKTVCEMQRDKQSKFEDVNQWFIS